MKFIRSAAFTFFLVLTSCAKTPDVTGTYQTTTFSASALTDPMTGQQIPHNIEHGWRLSLQSNGTMEFASEDGTSLDEAAWKIEGNLIKFTAQPPQANGPSMDGLNLASGELHLEPNGDLISTAPDGGNSLRWTKNH